MARLSSIKMDLSDTAEIEYVDGVFATLRPMPNPEFDAYMTRIKKPQLRRIRKGTMADGEMTTLIKEAMANTVLVGVRGLEDDDDKPIEYTSEWGLSTFLDPQFYDFYQFCRTEAADMDNFRKEVELEAAGN